MGTKTINTFDVVTTLANSDKLALWKAASAATKAITYANFITAAAASLVLSDYVKKNGTVALTANWDIGSGRRILADGYRARGSAGLLFEDDGANVAIYIEDGGKVTVGGSTAPVSLLQIIGAGGLDSATPPRVTVRNTTNGTFNAVMQEIASLDFYSDDVSGGAARTRVRISCENANTSFGTADITLAVDVGGVLGKVMRFSGVGGSLLVGDASGAPTLSSSAAGVDVTGSTLRLRTARTPASAAAAGNAGEICWDTGFLYVCTATNTWERVAIATW